MIVCVRGIYVDPTCGDPIRHPRRAYRDGLRLGAYFEGFGNFSGRGLNPRQRIVSIIRNK